GVVNADGWGAAMWLDDGKPEPALYRSPQPIWADSNLGWIGDRLRLTAAVAAVRSATPGIAYDLSCVQPFVSGRIAFLHNGFITGWQRGPARMLREGLGDAAYQAVQGGSDSEGLFALVLDALEQGAASLADAVRMALRRLEQICAKTDATAVATLLVCDGAVLVGARHAAGLAPASLYAAATPASARELAWCIASEPLWPDGRFQEVPVGQLAVARAGEELRVEPIG
ncbi:MAG TPA: class II glutamine amidotransferase, partial [Myxococcales bacterium]|nr:class II glutamine amidotransferase [Myxococcales bacterium]